MLPKNQILLSNPVGIDAEIQKIQKYLPTKITYLQDYCSFGLADKIESRNDGTKKKTVSAKIYTGRGKDNYFSVYPDTKERCIIFFYLKNTERKNGLWVGDVDMIGFADLKTIGKETGGEVLVDFEKYLLLAPAETILTGIKKTAKEVFSEFDFSNRTFIDIQPFYVFSLQFQVTYNDRC